MPFLAMMVGTGGGGAKGSGRSGASLEQRRITGCNPCRKSAARCACNRTRPAPTSGGRLSGPRPAEGDHPARTTNGNKARETAGCARSPLAEGLVLTADGAAGPMPQKKVFSPTGLASLSCAQGMDAREGRDRRRRARFTTARPKGCVVTSHLLFDRSNADWYARMMKKVTNYIWVQHTGPPDRSIVLDHYSPSRSHAVALERLDG